MNLFNMVTMLTVRIECKKISVEKLTECIHSLIEPCFKAWLYRDRVYSIFRVSSLSVLSKVIDKLTEHRIKFCWT